MKDSQFSRQERDFPSTHTDFLEQAIDYRVPVDMFSTLAEYGGSVMAERTLVSCPRGAVERR